MAKPLKAPQSAQPQQQKAAVRPQAQAQTAAKAKASTSAVLEQRNDTLIFGRETFKWMLIGLGIMAVGYLCMTGGAMPSPDVWKDSIIYSPLRTKVAPLLIMIGLGVQVYAIFKKN